MTPEEMAQKVVESGGHYYLDGDEMVALAESHQRLSTGLAVAKAAHDALQAQLAEARAANEQWQKRWDTEQAATGVIVAALEQAERERDDARAEVADLKAEHRDYAVARDFADKCLAEAARWQAEHGRVVEAVRAATLRPLMTSEAKRLREDVYAALTPAPTGDGPQAGGGETPCVVCRRAPCVCCREYISMCQHGEVVGHCEACKTPASGEGEGRE